MFVPKSRLTPEVTPIQSCLNVAQLKVILGICTWIFHWFHCTVYHISCILQGVTFPCIHAMMGRWAPKLERSKLVSFSFSGDAQQSYNRLTQSH